MTETSAMPPINQNRWPLAPGNAPPEYEALSARIREQWKVPLHESQLSIIRGAFTRSQPEQRAAS